MGELSPIDKDIQRGLHDRVYEKRKAAALELERQIRQYVATKDTTAIKAVIIQLCRDFAYAVHQPNARNGGLIGLAAAAIALGQNEVADYLEDIIQPVLACFGDQDAKVRYYACESMYNIAKVAKGEILPYFNEIFDALCKLSSDSELSVKNGADLLDRLIKDIVAEKAVTYSSVVSQDDDNSSKQHPTPAFSLERFIPLLAERIYVINPLTRMFLVSWIVLLDSIPDLELVTFLPDFLSGLLNFLADPIQDVRVATRGAIEGFLSEIKSIAQARKTLDEFQNGDSATPSSSSALNSPSTATGTIRSHHFSSQNDATSPTTDTMGALATATSEGLYIHGQDINIDYARLLDILLHHLDSAEEEIQLTSLRWVGVILDISQFDLLSMVPRILTLLLPVMASESEQIRVAANKVNEALKALILPLENESDNDENEKDETSSVKTDSKSTRTASTMTSPSTRSSPRGSRPSTNAKSKRQSDSYSAASSSSSGSEEESDAAHFQGKQPDNGLSFEVAPHQGIRDAANASSDKKERNHIASLSSQLDYDATVNALTLHLLNEKVETRIAALNWLILLHQKAPLKIMATNDGTFPALLKTLSDSSDAVVTRDLQLLAQICESGNDAYFKGFMVSLLGLLKTDRRLLETRGNLIIRQLCLSLSSERIYSTLALILRDDEDIDFTSMMVQNLNNSLIAAPEMNDLRRRLRNLDSKDGAELFTTLFTTWCHNAVATFSLCLLSQTYEHAFHLLQIFADLDVTVSVLIQVDKLVQLLESPAFTYLRLQLLEPEVYPYLYKCLYGLLMLLPQSAAFATLRNRLNSVSPITYLDRGQNMRPTGGAGSNSNAPSGRPNLKRSNTKEEVAWASLLDNFREIQICHQAAYRESSSNDKKPSRNGDTAAGASNRPRFGVNQSDSRQMHPQHHPQLGPAASLSSPQPIRGGTSNSNNSSSSRHSSSSKAYVFPPDSSNNGGTGADPNTNASLHTRLSSAISGRARGSNTSSTRLKKR